MTDATHPDPKPGLSVVIPARNEAQRIGRTLEALVTGAAESRPELIVVDGGSRDDTTEIARSFGEVVIVSEPGRARQMNAGAAVATCECLLFLHADTLVPQGYDLHVYNTLAGKDVVSGAFWLVIDASCPMLRLIEYGVNIRNRWLSLPYGDQGLFMRAETFRMLDGFADIPVMEDYDLVRRLRRIGRVRMAQASVRTCARRWQDQGIMCATWTNLASIIGYHMGVSPRLLKDWRDGFCARPVDTER